MDTIHGWGSSDIFYFGKIVLSFRTKSVDCVALVPTDISKFSRVWPMHSFSGVSSQL
jgi:hypothetical protein